VQLLLAERSRRKEEEDEEEQETAPKHICPCCHEGVMVIIAKLPWKSRSPHG